jgi:hypothetical protein
MAEIAMKQASFFDVLRTVIAGFLGVRRRDAHDRETASIKPVHVIVAGVLAAALFVGTLLLIVHLVVG